MAAIQKFERFSGLGVQGNGFCLAGFMLDHREMGIELSLCLVVNLIPAKLEKIADPKRCTSAKDNHGVVTVLTAKQKVIGHFLELFLIADGFGCGHNKTLLFVHDRRKLHDERANVTVCLDGHIITCRRTDLQQIF